MIIMAGVRRRRHGAWARSSAPSCCASVSELLSTQAGRALAELFNGLIVILVVLFMPKGLADVIAQRRVLAASSARNLREYRVQRHGPHRGTRVTKRFGGLAAVSEVSFDLAGRRDPRPHRSQRIGQDDAGQRDHGRPAASAGDVRFRGHSLRGRPSYAIGRLG